MDALRHPHAVEVGGNGGKLHLVYVAGLGRCGVVAVGDGGKCCGNTGDPPSAMDSAQTEMCSQNTEVPHSARAVLCHAVP